ncbi:MAG: DEP domain-containing protein [Cyanobacteria bacterium P01_D01_bin.123]
MNTNVMRSVPSLPRVKKIFVISLLSTHFKISVAAATKVANDWMDGHPDWQWAHLKQAVLDGDIHYEDRRLIPARLSSFADLERLRRQMLDIDGLDIGDRRYRMKLYYNCFVGSEAVDWLVRTQGLSRDEAVVVGRRLVRHNSIEHVLGEQDFADEYYFYRFV